MELKLECYWQGVYDCFLSCPGMVKRHKAGAFK